MGAEARSGALVLRFATAGALNTLAGAAVILALDLGLGLAPSLANAAGYFAGFLLAWVLHRRFVFRSGDASLAAKARYAASTAFAFGANQAALHAILALGGAAPATRAAAQVAGIATYSVLQFLLLRSWVFRPEAR